MTYEQLKLKLLSCWVGGLFVISQHFFFNTMPICKTVFHKYEFLNVYRIVDIKIYKLYLPLQLGNVEMFIVEIL